MYPSSRARAVISNSGGTVLSSTMSEWYLVTRWPGDESENIPRPSWSMLLVLPCIKCAAGTTAAPNAAAIA